MIDIASILVILALILVAWSKFSKKTIPELIRDIIDVIKGAREDTADYAMEVIDYD